MNYLSADGKKRFGDVVSSREHYDGFLAEHYSWMFGDFGAKVREFTRFFERHLGLRTAGLAVDLGCGSGFQSIALANLGYRVLAIDLSRELLNELETRSAGLQIKPIHGDILEFNQHCTEEPDLIICMGDTLTHLESPADVENLFQQAFATLANKGKFILSFRDNTTELKGTKRFIPVSSDENKIMTCFLEFKETHINVTDLIHKHTSEGWKLEVSSYRKLRLSAEWVLAKLTEAGFGVVECVGDRGVISILSAKELKL